MDITKEFLAVLENGDEEENITNVKSKFNLKSERNARLLLYVLENQRENVEEKINKEIRKLENKKEKEIRKISKRMNSYNQTDTGNHNYKINKINAEIRELAHTLSLLK